MALYKSPLTIDGEVTTEECVMSHMTKHGVKYVQIYGVDNAIVRVGGERMCYLIIIFTNTLSFIIIFTNTLSFIM